MPNTCYMLYILALRTFSYHFECCMRFDVVSALLVSTLFPIIILMDSAVHVVSLLAPLGLDAKTAFLAQFRME